MNKARIIIIVVVLIIIGLFVFMGSNDSTKIDNPDLAKVDVIDAKAVVSPSFECTDKTEFTAEFITEDEVSIKTDGAVVRTLTYVGPGLTFSANGFTYDFKNEGVKVTDGATKKSTDCTQVLKDGQTAMNFGDPVEDAKLKDPLAIVKKNIEGKWQSVDSATASIEFTSAGVATEMKDGAVVVTGKYSLFTSAKAPKTSFKLVKDIVYVEIKPTDKKTASVYYAIAEIEGGNLFLQTSDGKEIKGYTK